MMVVGLLRRRRRLVPRVTATGSWGAIVWTVTTRRPRTVSLCTRSGHVRLIEAKLWAPRSALLLIRRIRTALYALIELSITPVIPTWPTTCTTATPTENMIRVLILTNADICWTLTPNSPATSSAPEAAWCLALHRRIRILVTVGVVMSTLRSGVRPVNQATKSTKWTTKPVSKVIMWTRPRLCPVAMNRLSLSAWLLRVGIGTLAAGPARGRRVIPTMNRPQEKPCARTVG